MATAVHPGPSLAASFDGRAPGWPWLATGVLDLLREAVLVLGRDARLLGSNRVADTLLREGDGLALSAGAVVASTPGATHALRRCIERAVYGEAGRVQVPRSGRTALTLLVEPHPQDVGGPAAAVVFATDDVSRGPRDEDLAVRHGLTPAERCVAQLLCAGVDLERIARELEISRSTVRGHLKQIFGKTHTHRQAELVCKLLSES
jgi:DNA-binding CsgD family transcriptional regulator